MAAFDLEAEVRRLTRLLDEAGLTEIEYEIRGRRLRVARAPAVQAAPPSAAPTLSPKEGVEAPAGVGPEHPGAVLAPVVGTVYVAPEPGAPPFVRVGDSVTEGQTLLVIEAMKTMNPVVAPRAGRVAEILVEDGTPTEYGEVLMILE